jgi:hypothetical protein
MPADDTPWTAQREVQQKDSVAAVRIEVKRDRKVPDARKGAASRSGFEVSGDGGGGVDGQPGVEGACGSAG